MALSLLAASALVLAAQGPVAATGSSGIAVAEPLLPAESQTEIVESQTDRYLRLTVPVMIEGQGPYDFMVDTGSEATVVTDRVQQQLGLRSAGSAIVVGMASRVPVELVMLDGLEFAARVFDGLEAPLLAARNVGADGILGLDTLQDLRVLIDFRDNTIAVNDAAALGGNRGYDIVVRARRKLGRLVITEATIDNVRTAVILDTGAHTSIGNMALKRKLRARKGTVVTNKDVNGHNIVGAIDMVRLLAIGEMQLSNLPIMFTDGPAFEQLGFSARPAMILGMRDLRAFDRVAIDFATRQILFDAPPGTASRGRTSRDRTGAGERPAEL
jgi:predicted aspartyl protease